MKEGSNWMTIGIKQDCFTVDLSESYSLRLEKTKDQLSLYSSWIDGHPAYGDIICRLVIVNHYLSTIIYQVRI